MPDQGRTAPNATTSNSDDEAYAYCRCEQTELRRYPTANGTIQYKHQCLKCGRGVGNAIAHSKVQGLNIPDFDFELRDRHHTNFTAKSEAFWAFYDAYLKSEDWELVRLKVLAREKYMCQGCGHRATQVHHLTYDHLGAEFLFELMALCDACHKRVHKVNDK